MDEDPRFSFPMNVHALLVGIEAYDQPDWDVPGPCRSAIAAAQWLLSIRTIPENIQMFLDSVQDLTAEIDMLRGRGVNVQSSARWEELDRFCRNVLGNGCVAHSRLFIFWSGHGCTNAAGNRVFFCRDYVERLPNRVFNASNFLRRLKTRQLACFADQIFLADVCGVYSNETQAEATENLLQGQTRQAAYFATPEGAYATALGGHGVFADAALAVLGKLGEWPDPDIFGIALEKALKHSNAPSFRIAGLRPGGELVESVIGTIAHSGNLHYRSVIDLLTHLDVRGATYLPHYYRTVADLGIPDLARAQGISGIVAELSSLQDPGRSGRVPAGLLQFRKRLAGEAALADLINNWLRQNAKGQENTLEEIGENLAAEAQQKLLLILTEIDEKERISAFKPYLCNNNGSLVPIEKPSFLRQTVQDWNEFERAMQGVLKDFYRNGLLDNFEIHFVADLPLFDRPFHMIPVQPGGPNIGQLTVVVVRHRLRVLSRDRRLRKNWLTYADALRGKPPSGIKWLKIERGKSVLPNDRGLCFACFSLPASATRAELMDILKRLLLLGAPYLYVPHAEPVDSDWQQLADDLANLSNHLDTLDPVPGEFANRRMAGNPFACDATLLWDDPRTNPFLCTRGPRIE
jgi:hypothetical protein